MKFGKWLVLATLFGGAYYAGSKQVGRYLRKVFSGVSGKQKKNIEDLLDSQLTDMQEKENKSEKKNETRQIEQNNYIKAAEKLYEDVQTYEEAYEEARWVISQGEKYLKKAREANNKGESVFYAQIAMGALKKALRKIELSEKYIVRISTASISEER